MQKLKHQIQQFQQALIQSQKQINQLQQEKQYLLKELSRQVNEKEKSEKQVQQIINDLLKQFQKQNEEMQKQSKKICQNINIFKLAKQYIAKIPQTSGPFNLSFQIKGYQQIQNLQDQEQKYEKSKKFMQQQLKHYEDEEYKLRIRTTLTEIQLKQMKEMQKRK